MAPPIAHIILTLVLYVFITTAQIHQVTTLKVKLGSCPMELDFPSCDTEESRRECSVDGDCLRGLKCCQSGCGNRCVLALQDKRGSCPSYNPSSCALQAPPSPDECHQDLQCPGSERCCCIDCVRKCTATVTVKSGECPPEESPCPQVQTNKCEKDGECAGQKKCCNVCGKICLIPTKERDGFCPVSASCVAPRDKPLCFRDIDCPPRQKCCLSMNRMECMEPMAVKPGTCPRSRIRCPRPQLTVKCKSDNDCPRSQKCCILMCHQECVDPIKQYV